MSWLGILGRAAWDVVGHPTEANPGEDKWLADHVQQAEQQQHQHQEPQHHHQDNVSHHHDSVGHDMGHSHGDTGGW
jgi:hypothetical protein